jgi:hypothetical protein
MTEEPKVGQVVRVTAKHSNHDYELGRRYVVCKTDTDDKTAQLAGAIDNASSGWIQWAEVDTVTLGWEFCESVLPREVARILAACKGSPALALRRDVKDALLQQLPDLRERILSVVAAHE